MAVAILMPALSPTMTEGTLASWMKAEGDTVSSGDVIAEIETDKATMEVEAVDEGVLGKILVDAGTEGVAVNQAIAILLEDGESLGDVDVAALSGGASAPASPAVAEETPAAAPSAAPVAAPAAPPAPAAPSSGGNRRFASPLARRMAEQANIDLGALTGSGPNGRIVKRDIEAAQAAGVSAPAAPQTAVAPAAAPSAPSASPEFPGMPEYEAIPNSSMRKVIARRLTESKQGAPHFYLTVDCEIDELLSVRKELNARGDDYKLSVNDLVIKAAALALKKVPAANATWTEEEIRLWKSADVSVAVAIEGGLITPVIRGAENKGLKTISEEMKDLASRARDGKLMPEDYQGGTFSVSNLGMFGIKEFSAVINPPQGAILAVGAGEQRPVVKDGALAIATVMSCTLSVDHRVVDGAVGAEFLSTFKKLIEDPLSMLL